MRQAAGPNGILSAISSLRGWISPDKKKKKSLLYVSDEGAGMVNIYSVPKYTEVGQITDGIDEPEGLATDKKGNLYVTNIGGDTVTVYKPGQTSPFLTLAEPNEPVSVAVGSNDDVYVGDFSGAVEVFAPGATSPSRRLTNAALEYVLGLGVDASNDVYAAGLGASGAAVVEYADATGTGTNLGLTGLSVPAGAFIDNNKNLAISDFGDDEVLIYPPGETSPSSTFSAPSPDRSGVNKAKNEMYIPEGDSDALGVYDYPTGTLVTTIDIGNFAAGAALSPAPKP
jgi:hypothetical protein